MKKYILIDACLGGTGIRDYYNGGYLIPSDLKISQKNLELLDIWLSKYQNEFYNGYNNLILVDNLDNEGIYITSQIEKELAENIKVAYYSDAHMKIISHRIPR